MNLLEAIILGIIQGLTEFLPVSSSGHIELGKYLLNIQIKDPLLFSIVVHGATALSTIVVFWKDIWNILTGLFKFQWNTYTKYVMKIVLSMIPVGIVGVLFEKELETFFEGKIFFVGLMLIFTAILLYLSTIIGAKDKEVGFGSALVAGLAQTVAILPGISRSGATISTLLMLGIDREKAARFSFLMVLPPILGAVALKINTYFSEVSEVSTLASENMEVGTWALVGGFLAAFISGLFACKWMILIVKKSKLIYFSYYCLAVGLLAISATLFS